MKLLTSVLPRSGRILPAGGWFTLAICGFLVGLEIVGRYATTDVHDGLAGFALLIAILAVVTRHRREPLGWVRGIGNWSRWLGGSLPILRYDHGLDFRGSPPLPRSSPPEAWILAAALVVWSGLAALAWAAFPSGWRQIGIYSSYTIYLLFLLILWTILLAVTFVGVYVPVAVLDKWLKRWLGDTDRRGAEVAAVIVYALIVSTIAWAIPPTWILGLCLVVSLIAWMIYLPKGADGAAVLWRSGPDQPVYAVPFQRLIPLMAGLASLLVFAVLLTAC